MPDDKATENSSNPCPARKTLSRKASSGIFALGAVVLAALTAGTWLTAHSTTVLGAVSETASGTDAVAVLPTGALIWGAAAVANLLAGRVARRIIGVVAALLAAGLVWAVAGFLANPESVAVAALTEITGTTTIDSYDRTALPIIALVVTCLLVVAAAVIAILPAADLARTRYDRAEPPGRDTPVADVRNLDQWDALTRGEDPTRSDPDVREHPKRG